MAGSRFDDAQQALDAGRTGATGESVSAPSILDAMSFTATSVLPSPEVSLRYQAEMSAEPDFDLHPEGSTDEPWRKEVASRLNHYRARRRRKGVDETSMRLDFDEPEPEPPSRAGAADTDFYRRANAAFDYNEIPLAHAEVAPSYSEPAAHAERDEVERDADWLYTGHPKDSVSVAIAACEPADTQESGYDPDFDFDVPRKIEPQPESARPDTNLIVFPRSTWTGPSRTYELAEPVVNQPRILDVPEEAVPMIQGPLFADIQLEPQEPAAEPVIEPEFELPLQVAQVAARAYAGLVDALLVVVASSIFCGVVWQMIPSLPAGKPLLAAAAVVPVFFWCVYQYLFLVYAGSTPGMGMAGIRLSTFEGRVPNWMERRRRALSLALSCVSVGLGFAWAMVDHDLLCWHDRMSGTYVTQR